MDLRAAPCVVDVVDSEDGSVVDVDPGVAAVFGVQWRGRVLGPDGLLAPAGVTGPVERARRYRSVGATTSILVRFGAGGAAAFGVPASALAGSSVALDDVVDRAVVADLVARVVAAPDKAAARAVVVDFVAGLAAADEDRAVDKAVSRALTLLDRGLTVGAVAKDVGLSERTLERRLLARVGLSPKKWQALRRFERALAAARASSSSSLTVVALDAGYYDEAHFHREFRARVGPAPARRLRSR